MTELEYILPLVSILVGLAIADLSISFHRLLRHRKKILWHRLPLLSALLVLLTLLQFWWQLRRLPFIAEIWAYYWALLIIVANFVAIFLLASAALPDEIPKEGLRLDEFYFENAKYFWTLFVVFLALLVTMQSIPVAYVLIGGGEVRLLSVLGGIGSNIVAVLVYGSLAVVRSRMYHSWLVPILLLLSVVQWAGLKI